MRKVFGVSVVLGTLATLAFTVSVAMGVTATTFLHNPQAQDEKLCDTSEGAIWHFVHTKPGASSGTIHVVTDTGSAEQGNAASPANVLHYYVEYPGGNISGTTHDNVPSGGSGSKLVLSHCDTAPPPPPPPTPPPPLP